MKKSNAYNIDEETIHHVGLSLSTAPINAIIAPDARVFRYPHLEDVYVMESDLYGNTMPKGSCFLVFNGNHGLIGMHLKLETLRTASVNDIKTMVAGNNQG
jgi:hypothetical protein